MDFFCLFSDCLILNFCCEAVTVTQIEFSLIFHSKNLQLKVHFNFLLQIYLHCLPRWMTFAISPHSNIQHFLCVWRLWNRNMKNLSVFKWLFSDDLSSHTHSHTRFVSLFLSIRDFVLNCVSSALVMHGSFLTSSGLFSGNGIKNDIVVKSIKLFCVLKDFYLSLFWRLGMCWVCAFFCKCYFSDYDEDGITWSLMFYFINLVKEDVTLLVLSLLLFYFLLIISTFWGVILTWSKFNWYTKIKITH